MINVLFTLLATALSLLAVDLIFPGVSLASFPVAMIAAVVIGIFNATLRPVLSTLSLPLNIVTLGAFSLVVNGLCFWLAAAFVPGFGVHGLLSFILAPVVLSLVNTFLTTYIAERQPVISGASDRALIE